MLDVFRSNGWFQFGDFDLDPGDEMADRPPGSNCLFKGSVQPPSAFCGTCQFHQQVLGARLPDSLDCGTQFIRVNALLELAQD